MNPIVKKHEKDYSLRSLRDLAAFKAKNLCSEEKSYYKQFIDVYEKKLLDDLVKNAIDRENMFRVSPVIKQYTENNTDIPIPFEVDGRIVNQIRVSGEPPYIHCEASFNGEHWRYMDDNDILRLYNALEEAGCLDNIE
ncbi:MAG: hypothetical protein IJP81_04740 [Bacteroidales bacterium]|nr:hypothetical protein [Bacteroidales bacterium]